MVTRLYHGLRFQSTSSARRTTCAIIKSHFPSTISIHVLREEDDFVGCLSRDSGTISIHVLREEDDLQFTKGGDFVAISIHVLREEDDLSTCHYFTSISLFQSTSSARRTTSLRCDGVALQSDFNPRPPRGGRRLW